MSPAPLHTCSTCSAALAADQRFCLHCGGRNGHADVGLEQALGLLAASPVPAPPRAASPAPVPVAAGTSRGRRAAGAAAVLGAGLLIGTGLGPASGAPRAAPRGAVAVVAVPGAPPAAVGTSPAADTPEVDADADAADDEAPVVAEDAEAPSEAPAEDEVPAATPSTGDDDAEPSAAPTATPTATARVSHVWLIALRGHDATETFGPTSPAPYLSRDLVRRGTLLRGWTPPSVDPRATTVATLTGRLPADPPPAGGTAPATLGDQLTSLGSPWRVYLEERGTGCVDPLAGLPGPVDAAACAEHEVPLARLGEDLAQPAASVPALSLVVPGPCRDGRTDPCPDGGRAGLTAADAFLRTVVPQITGSAAYKAGGALVITGEAPAGWTDLLAPVPATGALVLTSATRRARVLTEPTGPVALLRAIEDQFGLPALGHAADPTTTPLPLTDA